jgi:hypothetical protein
MSKILLGIICGFLFGAISVGTMIPLDLPEKKRAMAGAFTGRFAIGLAIGASNLPAPGWLNGLIFGSLLSLPDAIITKAWIPIMTIGVIGGIAFGAIVAAFGV